MQDQSLDMRSENTRVLFFIARLTSGGKERRLIELLTYLKKTGGYELMVVVTRDQVHYTDFFQLGIPYHVIRKKWMKNDLSVFYKFYKVCKQFRPHIIHSWGRVQTFYALPAAIIQRIPLVNGQITAAPPKLNKWSINHVIDRLNFKYSKLILSNSNAGIGAFNPPPHKWRVIYNGINMNRFKNLPEVELIKAKYKISTPYAVLMAATYSPHKDYSLFFRVAELVTGQRSDITFIGVGAYDKNDSYYREMLRLSGNNPNIIFQSRCNEIEALINACTIGVLFSNRAVHGEGISNSLMEYMSLGKPVIANDAGGTKELVRHNKNGYLVTNEPDQQIAAMICELIDNPSKYTNFGEESKRIIEQSFSLERMGNEFEKVYEDVLEYKTKLQPIAV